MQRGGRKGGPRGHRLGRRRQCGGRRLPAWPSHRRQPALLWSSLPPWVKNSSLVCLFSAIRLSLVVHAATANVRSSCRVVRHRLWRASGDWCALLIKNKNHDPKVARAACRPVSRSVLQAISGPAQWRRSQSAGPYFVFF